MNDKLEEFAMMAGLYMDVHGVLTDKDGNELEVELFADLIVRAAAAVARRQMLLEPDPAELQRVVLEYFGLSPRLQDRA